MPIPAVGEPAGTRRTAPPLSFDVDRDAAAPLHQQVYEGLRAAILSGRLAAGSRLPSSRGLARDLRVSRTTVLAAFEQLAAEGFLVGRAGAGTFVDRAVSPARPRGRRTRAAAASGSGAATAGEPPAAPPVLSRRGRRLAGLPSMAMLRPGDAVPFRPGLPGLDLFPSQLWSRLLSKWARRLPAGALGYPDPAGYPPLRQAVAEYVRASRAVICDATQVIIVSGSQQAIDLTARLLLDPGDVVWAEDPGYPGARVALGAAGADLRPLPVDGEGADPMRAAAAHPPARLVYVTPSHQYPLGVTMSLGRRLSLLAWAAAAGAWILEDDYDSEYRYRGRPLAALQGLDVAGRVIYVGSFSKVLFPGLRLGYMVVPPPLLPAFAAARALADRGSGPFLQAVLADFITGGHLQRHLRRTRLAYAERQAALLRAARSLPGLGLRIGPADAGMHLLGWLPAGADDARAAAAATRAGIVAPPLSAYARTPQPRGALLLGYTAVPPGAAPAALRRLADALAADLPRRAARSAAGPTA